MTKYKIGDTVIKASGTIRLRQGQQIRFCCLDEDVEVIAVHTVAQRYRACLAELGQQCSMCQEAESRPRMAMNILVYSEQGVEVRQWVFGSDKYRQLAEIKGLVPDGLDKHDLIMSCLNENFQQVSFQIHQAAEWQSGKFGPPEQVRAKFDQDKVDLGRFLRAKYSAFGAQPTMGMGQPTGFGGMVPAGFGGMPGTASPPVSFVGTPGTSPASAPSPAVPVSPQMTAQGQEQAAVQGPMEAPQSPATPTTPGPALPVDQPEPQATEDEEFDELMEGL